MCALIRVVTLLSCFFAAKKNISSWSENFRLSHHFFLQLFFTVLNSTNRIASPSNGETCMTSLSIDKNATWTFISILFMVFYRSFKWLDIVERSSCVNYRQEVENWLKWWDLCTFRIIVSCIQGGCRALGSVPLTAI